MCLRACNRMSPISNRRHDECWCRECIDEEIEREKEEQWLDQLSRQNAALDQYEPATDSEWFRWLDRNMPRDGVMVVYKRIVRPSTKQESIA